MAMTPKGKRPLAEALCIIFGRGGSPKVADVEKELKKMIGWSPSHRNLYLYATKWNCGQLVGQKGAIPKLKRLRVRDMREAPVKK